MKAQNLERTACATYRDCTRPQGIVCSQAMRTSVRRQALERRTGVQDAYNLILLCCLSSAYIVAEQQASSTFRSSVRKTSLWFWRRVESPPVTSTGDWQGIWFRLHSSRVSTLSSQVCVCEMAGPVVRPFFFYRCRGWRGGVQIQANLRREARLRSAMPGTDL